MTEPDDEARKDEAHRLKMVELKRQQDAEVARRKDKKGLLLLHTGDGKGKSTAGFGLALRAAGHGLRVAVVQFTKGSWKTGEGLAFKRFPEIDHFIVLDELNIVVDCGYLPASLVVETLRRRPPDLHVCVTGRGAPPELVEIADTVTEMRMIKHAYDAGIRAQRGIEF
jgi:cob(I)alamin adenosyltransferase